MYACKQISEVKASACLPISPLLLFFDVVILFIVWPLHAITVNKMSKIYFPVLLNVNQFR